MIHSATTAFFSTVLPLKFSTSLTALKLSLYSCCLLFTHFRSPNFKCSYVDVDLHQVYLFKSCSRETGENVNYLDFLRQG